MNFSDLNGQDFVALALFLGMVAGAFIGFAMAQLIAISCPRCDSKSIRCPDISVHPADRVFVCNECYLRFTAREGLRRESSE